MNKNILTVLILILLTLVILSSPRRSANSAQGSGRGRPAVADDVRAALSRLPRVAVEHAGEDGVPTFVEGRIARVDWGGGHSSEEALRVVLGEISPVFRLRPDDLRLLLVETDSLGITHATYRQRKNGLDVVGGDLKIHVGAGGEVFAVNGSARDGADISPVPTVSAEDASPAARGAREINSLFSEEARLVYLISARNRSMHLAHEVTLEGTTPEGTPFRDRIYVNAHDGQVIEVHPQIFDALNRRIHDAAGWYTLPGSLRRGEGGGAAPDPTVNVNYDLLGVVYGFYRSVFNRDSFDNAGTTLTSTVHVGYNYNNAFWNGTQMAYGDGDGQLFTSLAASLDITAHEFTHAVTQYESALVYSAEPGALNEAMSDIFGAACEAWSAGGVGTDTWKLGEDAYTPSIDDDALRYMDTPTEDGISRDFYPERFVGLGDNGGVHINSGIANLAFKLLVTGGSHPRGKTTVVVPGIGIERARAIFYRANTEYLTANSGFGDARAATARAAADLFSAQPDIAAAVQKAWDAVGAPGGAAPPPPPASPPSPPSNLAVSLVSSSRIDITWNDNSTNENGFHVERSTNSGVFAVIDRTVASVNRYSNTGLLSLTNYCYRVRAYNSAGTSAFAGPVCARTFGPLDPPAPPSNLSARAASTSTINLSWRDNSTNEAGFKIERAQGDGGFTEVTRVSANTTTFSNTGLAPSATYTYRVSAFNSGGESVFSNGATASTSAPPGPPAAPANLRATLVSASRLDLRWEDGSANETGFAIELASHTGPFGEIGRVGANVTTFSVSPVIFGTMTKYRVRAFNGGLFSPYSNTAGGYFVCTGSVSPESASFGKEGGNGVINVNRLPGCGWGVRSDAPWITITSASKHNGPATVSYTVAPNGGPARTGTITILPSSIAGSFGFIEIRQESVAQPSAPVNLRSAPTSAASVTLAWDYPAGGSPLFVVERRTGCDSAFNTVAALRAQTFDDEDTLLAVQSYAYRVKAVTEDGESIYSNVAPGQGVSSSCAGGLESAPLWLFRGREADDDVSASRFALSPPPLWKWANKLARPESEVAARDFTLALSDVLPDPLPGTTRRATAPKDVLGNSNAVETSGADYVESATNKVVASVSAFRTLDAVYAHDYAVCTRFKGSRMTDAAPSAAHASGDTGGASVYFWRARTTSDGLMPEQATVFAVYVAAGERDFAVASRWLSDEYRPADADGYVITFQLWAADEQAGESLLRAVLQKFAARGRISFDNNQEPVAPMVFISEASYDYGRAVLKMVNNTVTPKTVNFTAVTWNAPNADSEARYFFRETVEPGESVIRLPITGRLNAVIYADDGDFVDKVYVADGHWFAFDDAAGGGVSRVQLTSKDCREATNLTAGDLIVAGCAEMKGAVGPRGYFGMVRALNPPRRPVTDVSNYRGLTFFAKGDGKSYRVGIETDSVARLGSTDWHQFVFTAPPEGRQIVIPLRAFAQQGWDASKLMPFTGRDVRSLVWSTIGDPHATATLSVDRIAFTNSLNISETTALPDTGDTAGPYNVAARVADDFGIVNASLLYSTDGGASYTRLSMNAGDDDGLHRAAIPGQPLNTAVRYYVEAADEDGNVATDPADAPFKTYRFQVSRRPHLLVDDFSDTDPSNTAGGTSFLFGHDSSGRLTASHDGGSLRLDYDVSAPGSFAGYSTSLRRADLTRFNALSFLIKGESGGEKVKVGLRDAGGNEHKVLVGEYAAEGVTTSWRKVSIPLAAFAGVRDFARAESFVLAFEHRVTSRRGVVRIDDIRFENNDYTLPLVVDNFNDAAGENGFGGSLWTASGGAFVEAAYDPSNRFGDNGAGYRVTFRDVTSNAWAAAGTDLAGVNASAYQTLSFYVKGAAGGERPNVYLASRNDGAAETRRFVDVERYTVVTTSWRRVDIPLADFAAQGVDLTRLAYFQLVFEFESMAGAVFVDNITINPVRNPIGDAEYFVRQHYVDFLAREPDAPGLNFWTGDITSCGADEQCREVKTINVSAAFFLSIEFQNTGFLVYRLYQTAYGEAVSLGVPVAVPVVRREEFLPDTRSLGEGVVVGQPGWGQQLEQNKNSFVSQFVRRQRFTDAYPSAMTPTEFVDKLNQNAGGVLTPLEHDRLVSELASSTDVAAARASVLRSVAEHAALARAETNRAFVLMQYYGYLRRDPDGAPDTNFGGWKFWLDKLNEHNGDFVRAEMVKAFINSLEYRGRFGRP